jgi:uncharacterized protein YceH (UPF0502 family)
MDLNSISTPDLLKIISDLMKRIAALEKEVIRLRHKVQVLEGA